MVGDSARAVDTVTDVNGVVVDSAPVTWSSTNTAVATVNAFGVVHAVSRGVSGLVAWSGAVVDSLPITVETHAAVAIASISPLQLIAGQPATLLGHQFSTIPAANAITIGTTSVTPVAADSTHIAFVVPDSDCAPAGHRTLTLRARGSTAQLRVPIAPSTPPVALPVGGVQTIGAAGVGCLQFAATPATPVYYAIITDITTTPSVFLNFEITQAVGDSANLGLNGYARARRPPASARTRPAARRRPTAARAVVAAATIGDVVDIRVPTVECDSAVATTGHVTAVSAHAIVVQDDSAAAGGFTAADFASIATEFDQFIYPVDTLHYGAPSDVDGNGRVILYYTPVVNRATTGEATIVGGFVSHGDLEASASCATSNQAEIIYLLAPDEVHAATTVRQSTRTALAHELQHLINAGNRLFTSHAAVFEEPWLDEALSHAGEDFVGRAEDGFTDVQRLNYATIIGTGNDYTAFYGPNLVRYQQWLVTPNATAPVDTLADSSNAVRGAAWSLLRYSLDQYAATAPATLTRALALGPATGIYNLSSTTGVAFDSIIEGWLVAAAAAGQVPGLAPRFAFVSYDMHDVESNIAAGTYPLGFTSFNLGTVALPDKVRANGGRYINITNAGPVPAFSLRLRNSDGTPMTDPGARIYILRMQ